MPGSISVDRGGRLSARGGSGRSLTARQRVVLDELEELFLAEGFIEFTLDDLAAQLSCSKSTLYALAPSKEQLATRVVRQFFTGAAHTIEERIAGVTDARSRIDTYLAAVAHELRRASPRFMRDIADFPPARVEYERNSRVAAERIRSFVADGVRDGIFRDVHASLIAEMVGVLIEAIQEGTIGQRARVSDAEAFAALAELLIGGLSR